MVLCKNIFKNSRFLRKLLQHTASALKALPYLVPTATINTEMISSLPQATIKWISSLIPSSSCEKGLASSHK